MKKGVVVLLNEKRLVLLKAFKNVESVKARETLVGKTRLFKSRKTLKARICVSILACLTVFLTFATLASSVSITAVAQKTVFVKGDNASIVVTLKNDAFYKTFLIEVNVRGGGLPPAPKRVPIELAAGEEKTLNIIVFTIDDGIPPGSYEVTLNLLEGENLLSKVVVSFNVEGTLKLIPDFQVFACRDEACTQRSSIYYKGNTVFLKYSSSIEGLNVNAVIKTPSGEKTVSLPASFTLETAGNHVVTATAFKQGFKQSTVETEFGVLEKPFTLIEERLGEEAMQTISKPESEEVKVQQQNFTLITIVLTIVLLAAIVAFLFFVKKKAKKK